jgi:hypothetical protein
MAIDRCPKCRSPDIKPTTTGRVRNTHHCNNCGQDFTLLATASLIGPAAATLIGPVVVPKVVTELWDDLKKVLGDPSDNRPPLARPQARAPLPPRQPLRGALPPRDHPMPPVRGQPPSPSPNRPPPPRVAKTAWGPPDRPNRPPDPRAGSLPRRPGDR